MEMNFRTKEESNRIQREEFLKLTPEERFYAFLDLMDSLRGFPSSNKKNISDNFVVEIKDGPQRKNKVGLFLNLANKHDVSMILVGGGAVNFHGYQRHSADVGFWIDTSTKNW